MTHLSDIFGPADIPLLLLVGLSILGGAFGARVFQMLRIPQVVGYIVIGILLGKSGLGLIGDEEIQTLAPVAAFALGVIGFLIGSELSRDVFRRHGKQFFIIMLSEGIGAFLAVGFATALVTYLTTGNAPASVALGLVLGAISSATAPAATVDVLWEFRTLGPLTSNVLAIVALDDALALFLFRIASVVSVRLLGQAGGGPGGGLLHSTYELGGAVVLGALAGLLLNLILHRLRDNEQSLTYLAGILTLLLGFSLLLKVDMILGSMTLGMVLVNLAPRRSKSARQIVERFARPIFVLFFVTVGAKLSVASMPHWLWWVVLAYVVGRTAGKMSGAWLGARASGAQDTVRKYLGLCLFSQAGVAIGLSILAGSRFSDVTIGAEAMGNIIVAVVTAATFVVQLIGPSFVKFAAARAGEIGRNVTEEDLLKSHKVEDFLDRSVSVFSQKTSMSDVIRVITADDAPYHMVTDDSGRIAGMISLDVLKQAYSEENVMDWLVAFDLMTSAPDPVGGDASLDNALSLMNQQGIDCLPVTGADRQYLGLVDRRSVNQAIRQEMRRRGRPVDASSS